MNVRIAAIKVRAIKLTHFGAILRAAKNANGKAKMAPIIVPTKAMAIVSSNKAGTPNLKSNKKSLKNSVILSHYLFSDYI